MASAARDRTVQPTIAGKEMNLLNASNKLSHSASRHKFESAQIFFRVPPSNAFGRIDHREMTAPLCEIPRPSNAGQDRREHVAERTDQRDPVRQPRLLVPAVLDDARAVVQPAHENREAVANEAGLLDPINKRKSEPPAIPGGGPMSLPLIVLRSAGAVIPRRSDTWYNSRDGCAARAEVEQHFGRWCHRSEHAAPRRTAPQYCLSS